MTAIDLDNVIVEFPIYMARARSFKNAVLRRVGGRIGADRDTGRVCIRSLNQVSMSVRPGDRVALVGPNGAGKSTLLRTLSGVYEPAGGALHIEGKISSLLDLSLGIDAEMTGYDNIVLRSVLLGSSFSEARKRIPEIAEFADLGDFLSLPLRTYSQGMALRLAFAVSTAGSPDIVLLDELINVGDADFAKKAQARLEQLVSKASILVLASHDFHALRRYCNKGAWLNGGTLQAFGPLEDVLAAYAQSLSAPA
ncbi:MAG: ABC transporter ATP-binding protein [Terricaulis sp.]